MQDTYGKKYYRKRLNDGRYIGLSKAIIQYLLREGIKTNSILDIGCATGGLLSYLRDIRGKDCVYTGIDHGMIPLSQFILRDEEHCSYIDIDLDYARITEEAKLRRHDVVICIETAEHLLRENEKNLTEFIAELTDSVLIFSASDARSYGHVNRRSERHWIKLLKKNGLEYRKADSEYIAGKFEKNNVPGFYTRHVFVMRRA